MNLKEIRKRMSKHNHYWWAVGLDGKYVLRGLRGHVIHTAYNRYEAERMTRSLEGSGMSIIGGMPVLRMYEWQGIENRE